MIRAVLTIQTVLLLLSLLLASCTATEHVLHTIDATQAAEAATSSLAPALASVPPAPAGMSRAEQRRYYAAQVAMAKASTAQKVKNSNNTTVEQKISNISPAVLGLVVALSALVGFVICKKL